MQAIRFFNFFIFFLIRSWIRAQTKNFLMFIPLSPFSKECKELSFTLQIYFFPEKVINNPEAQGKTFIKQGLISIICKGMDLLVRFSSFKTKIKPHFCLGKWSKFLNAQFHRIPNENEKYLFLTEGGKRRKTSKHLPHGEAMNYTRIPGILHRKDSYPGHISFSWGCNKFNWESQYRN